MESSILSKKKIRGISILSKNKIRGIFMLSKKKIRGILMLSKKKIRGKEIPRNIVATLLELYFFTYFSLKSE